MRSVVVDADRERLCCIERKTGGRKGRKVSNATRLDSERTREEAR